MGARKYGQKGYMEDERGRQGRPATGGPRPERQGPGGRGLGAPTATVWKCARCGASLDSSAELALDAACGGCGSDLHACVNCRFFDSSAPRECRAEIVERIAAKSKRNDCALFEPKRVKDFAADSGSDDDPKAAFDSLFDF